MVVTGSRDWDNARAITASLEALEKVPGLAVVIEGGALGADRIAGQWAARARARGIAWVRFPADWQRFGKWAGPLRNDEMRDWLLFARDRCGWHPYYLAFPLMESRGTWDMVRKCNEAGIKGTVLPGY